jgi:DNA-binding response OmpR family regulator
MTTVLVVADDTRVRSLITAVLRLDGRRVVEADDAHGALGALRRGDGVRPDLIVIDLATPGRDSLCALRSLKSPPSAAARTPVLVVADRGDDMDRIRATIEGALGFLTKPFSLASAVGPKPRR